MILAMNVNNSYISIGIFENNSNCNILNTFSISSDINRTSDEYASVIRSIFEHSKVDILGFKGAIVSSVVPQLTDMVSETVCKLIGIMPVIVGPGVKTGFSIKIDSPSEMGADLVANAAAIVVENKEREVKKASVIIDLGVANTIFAINRFGEYIGGCIFPGIKLSLDSLHSSTAQLPNVTMSLPEKAIGKNSRESLCSGVILGNAIMIDGFIDRFAKEMRCKKDELEIYATGKYAELVLKACAHTIEYRPTLTLDGLYYIYMKNKIN